MCFICFCFYCFFFVVFLFYVPLFLYFYVAGAEFLFQIYIQHHVSTIRWLKTHHFYKWFFSTNDRFFNNSLVFDRIPWYWYQHWYWLMRARTKTLEPGVTVWYGRFRRKRLSKSLIRSSGRQGDCVLNFTQEMPRCDIFQTNYSHSQSVIARSSPFKLASVVTR